MYTIYTIDDLRMLSAAPDYEMPHGVVAEYGRDALLRALRARDYARVEHQAVVFRGFVANIRGVWSGFVSFAAATVATITSRFYTSA